MSKLFIIISVLFISTVSFADKFSADAQYQVCFTPNGACTDLIVSAINQSRKQILVQAYSFTSPSIAKALILAYKRGVEVKIILDKSQFRSRGFSSAKFFTDYHLPVWEDFQPSIAHNKVMVIDNKTVITGSFNFTKAAQEQNAENVIIITDSELAKKYSANWERRANVSEKIKGQPSPFLD
jgi:phosphatidylserine/phosphatidylglycerophosphate/cardiolipin synthase-like enzyme